MTGYLDRYFDLSGPRPVEHTAEEALAAWEPSIDGDALPYAKVRVYEDRFSIYHGSFTQNSTVVLLLDLLNAELTFH